MKQFDKDIVRKNIHNRRIELRMRTQEELARASNINSESVSRYERGERLPRADVLFNLAEALQCDADYLIGRQDLPKHQSSDIKKELPILSRTAIEGLQKLSSDAVSDKDARIFSEMIDYLICGLLDSAGYCDEYGHYEDHANNESYSLLFDMIKAANTIKSLDDMPSEKAANIPNYGNTWNTFDMAYKGITLYMGQQLSDIVTAYVNELIYRKAGE